MTELQTPPINQTELEIFHGDCIEGMRTMDGESIDLVVTSPPYNLGVKYSAYKDDQAREAYLAWCLQWAEEIKRVLKPLGSFFLNIGASPSNPMLPFEIIEAFTLDRLFVLQNTIHWIKSISIDMPDGTIHSPGHFKPLTSPRFLNDCHEYVFHLTKRGNTPIDRKAIGVPYTDKSNINRWGHTEGSDKRCRGNVWFIPYKTIRDRDSQRPHPATFPVELAKKCILLHGRANETVMLDPFLGIGTAALAAQECNVRRFVGFDIDSGYLEVASRKTGAEIRKLEITTKRQATPVSSSLVMAAVENG